MNAVCVSEHGVREGADESCMPLPTRPQRYCDPASLILIRSQLVFGMYTLGSTLRPMKRPKRRLWLSPILPQLRLGKKIFHAKFRASEIAGTFVRVNLKFALN